MSDIFKKSIEYGIQSLLNKSGLDVEGLTNVITDFHDGVEITTPIDEVKKFRKILSESIGAKKHIIFIDDLDRINPNEVIELLEALQIFLTVENCVFILAVDYDVVIQGYKNKFGESFNVMKSKNFFDKIIQLPFRLPTVDERVGGQYVLELLNNVPNVSITSREEKEIIEIFKNSVGFNPREVKRLINSYWLSLEIYENKQEIDNVSSIYFTCMQTEYLLLYEFVKKYGTMGKKDAIFLSNLIKKINSSGLSSTFADHNGILGSEDSINRKMCVDLEHIIEVLSQDREEDEEKIKEELEDFLVYFQIFFEGVEEGFNDKFNTAITFNRSFDIITDKNKSREIARVAIHLSAEVEEFDHIKNIIESDLKLQKVLGSVKKVTEKNVLSCVIVEFNALVSDEYRWEVVRVLNDNGVKRNRVTTHKTFY